ncbi:MAG TPA: hypothetical protein VK211_14100 [Kamptonema sp.]|nr:hypothetical protein [Kamptonema sp.]
MTGGIEINWDGTALAILPLSQSLVSCRVYFITFPFLVASDR